MRLQDFKSANVKAEHKILKVIWSMSLEQYNAMQMCRIPCTQDKEPPTRKDGCAFLQSFQKTWLLSGGLGDLGLCLSHERMQAALVSQWAVSQQLQYRLVFADKFLCQTQSKRLWDEPAHPPKLCWQAADEIPSGLKGVEQVLESTCLESEEARRGGRRGQGS